MATRATLDVGSMSDRALWTAAFGLLARIDFADVSYSPGKLSHHASELRSVLLELRKRGIQLSLFPPAA